MDFPTWIEERKKVPGSRGFKMRLVREAGTTWQTIAKLARGERIHDYALACRVSKATDGAVPAHEMLIGGAEAALPPTGTDGAA